MSSLTDTVTIDGQPWRADQLRRLDPADAHTAEIVIEAQGIGFQETMSVLGGAIDQRDTLATNPEHFIDVGDIESGQRGAETFGMFGEPIYMHGVAGGELPEGLPFSKDPTFPVAVFGETAMTPLRPRDHQLDEDRPRRQAGEHRPTLIGPRAEVAS